MSVERDWLGQRESLHLLSRRELAHRAVGVRLDLRISRIGDDYAGRAVENYVLAAVKLVGCITQSHHGGQSQRTRENRDVRSSRASVSRNRRYRVSIELNGEAGC